MKMLCLRTSSEESASVCERPDVFSSFSSPLISAELLLLALRSSFKVGPWEISSTLMRPAVRANWLWGWIELIRLSASLFQFLKQRRFNEERMNQENQELSSEHAAGWLMCFVLIFDVNKKYIRLTYLRCLIDLKKAGLCTSPIFKTFHYGVNCECD